MFSHARVFAHWRRGATFEGWIEHGASAVARDLVEVCHEAWWARANVAQHVARVLTTLKATPTHKSAQVRIVVRVTATAVTAAAAAPMTTARLLRIAQTLAVE